MQERLHKVIARSGLASRRRAEQLIEAGRVTVDGERAHIGQKVDPRTARIVVDGTRLPADPDLVYYLMNKPAGVVSTADDPHGRPTVVELVPSEARVYPVGRLDVDSEGLILLTNDGDLTELVTHPRHEVEKAYLVRVRGTPGPAALRRLVEGVELEDGPAVARSVRRVDSLGGRAQVEVVMGEGRKREVRRMFDAIGYPVERLVRTRIGPISDNTLRPGEWRRLSLEEVRALYRDADG